MKNWQKAGFILSASLIMGLSAFSQTIVQEHWSPYDYPREIPAGVKVHTVVKGDTLWDIAQTYFQDPFLWPQIYQVNPYIKDPDLIYPGDPVSLNIGVVVDEQGVNDAMADAASEDGQDLAELEEFAEGEGDAVTDRSQSTSLLGSGLEMSIVPAGDRTDLECSTYVYVTESKKDKLPFDLIILGGESEIQESYSIDEVLYINQGANEGIQPGNLYSVRRVVAPVYTPSKKYKEQTFIGFAIDQIGIIKVVAVQESGATCMVTHACDSILKGDFLVPYEQEPIPLITEQPPFNRFAKFNKENAGYIIYSEDNTYNIGISHLANINLGVENDVAPGDIFVVFRSNPHNNEKKGIVLPDVYLGQAVVLRSLEKTSTVKIINAVSELKVGDYAVPYRVAFGETSEPIQ
ncbi:MAG: hypothetical protein CSA81_04945 [Acidobacteria bacterium]|nr:MAG: hypothetical protein CSA81_04945 [Acidobacteriota bacterium]